jgi:hypothetical protein
MRCTLPAALAHLLLRVTRGTLFSSLVERGDVPQIRTMCTAFGDDAHLSNQSFFELSDYAFISALPSEEGHVFEAVAATLGPARVIPEVKTLIFDVYEALLDLI